MTTVYPPPPPPPLGTVCNSVHEIWQQLPVEEPECRQKDESSREKVEVINENSATIQAQQAEIQLLRDQPAVSQKVS